MSFKSEPGDKECRTAVWSQGQACQGCAENCYRAGWEKPRVDEDNQRLAEAKREVDNRVEKGER